MTVSVALCIAMRVGVSAMSCGICADGSSAKRDA
jgi:hypothetical protein